MLRVAGVMLGLASYPLTLLDSTPIPPHALVSRLLHGQAPPERELGGPLGMLTPGAASDGHVPRNVRLALATLDLTRPHVEMQRMQALVLHSCTCLGFCHCLVTAS